MNPPGDFKGLIDIFLNLINITIPVIVALALLVFFKGLVAFIAKSGDEKSHAEGKNLMVWGLVALFVMISVWGIIKFFYADLGFSRPFGLPTLPINPSR